MRKLWYAGVAIAGGIVLFGATPAQADLLPGTGTGTAEQQADERLADLLGQSNGVNVSNPLRFSSLQDTPVGKTPVAQFKAGQNSPDLNPVLPGNAAAEPRPQLPAADVVGGALRPPGGAAPLSELPVQQLPLQQLPIRNLPLGDLLGGGLPLLGGLNPDGRRPTAAQRPTVRQAEVFEGGVPLLGGLGGLLPVNEAPAPDVPDTSGLPAGGTTVLPSAGQPAPQGRPAPAATPDDPRLHEEPIDDEASRRSFSPAGRPISGVDPQYN